VMRPISLVLVALCLLSIMTPLLLSMRDRMRKRRLAPDSEKQQ